MAENLKGKTAIVFGASKGIGLATSQLLAKTGCKVILAARNYEAIKAQADQLTHSGFHTFAFKCDVSNFEDMKSCIDFTIQTTGGIDIVVNNAGVIDPLAHLIESDPEQWINAVNVNLVGVYSAIRLVAPIMKSHGGGTIINMSSGAANSILEGWSHYCSTKAAVKKLTEVAHKELVADNIRVVGLSPGTVATDMMAKIRDAKINAVSNLDWSAHIPPEWVAQAIIFLCGAGGDAFLGTDFSLKTNEGRRLVGLPLIGDK